MLNLALDTVGAESVFVVSRLVDYWCHGLNNRREEQVGRVVTPICPAASHQEWTHFVIHCTPLQKIVLHINTSVTLITHNR